MKPGLKSDSHLGLDQYGLSLGTLAGKRMGSAEATSQLARGKVIINPGQAVRPEQGVKSTNGYIGATLIDRLGGEL